jgi:hypothetical protein
MSFLIATSVVCCGLWASLSVLLVVGSVSADLVPLIAAQRTALLNVLDAAGAAPMGRTKTTLF